jgi:centriolar protein POC1
MIASGSDDKTVRLWDIAHGKEEITKFTDHQGMINAVRFHPDSTCLASCGTDHKIKIFDCRSNRLLQHYDAHDDSVNTINFNSAGTHLISTSNDATIKIWDLRKGSILYTLYGHQGASTSAAFSPLGDYFVTGGADAVLLAWQSNLNQNHQEDLQEIRAKIETEVFVTEKEKVDKLPETRGTKMGKTKQKKRSAPEVLADETDEILDSVSVVAGQVNST